MQFTPLKYKRSCYVLSDVSVKENKIISILFMFHQRRISRTHHACSQTQQQIHIDIEVSHLSQKRGHIQESRGTKFFWFLMQILGRNHKGKCQILIFHQGQAKKLRFYEKSHFFIFFVKSFKARITILSTNMAQTISIQYLEEKSAIQLYFRKYWGKRR